MSQYPLFFAYRDYIYGNGFLADVTSHGRILCVEEEGEVWVYGVEPGGLAASGNTVKEALRAYRTTFTNILVDLAADAGSLDAFRDVVRASFHEVNASFESDWKAAVEAVRAGTISLADTPTENADTARCYVEVALANQAMFSPKDNRPAKLHTALAA